MEYEWYADVFFFTSLLMDLSAMLAAAAILNVKIRFFRCLAVCAMGVAGSIALLFLIKQYLIYSLILHLCIHPFMTVVIFWKRRRLEYIRIFLTVYVTLFVIGGVQNAVNAVVGSSMMGMLVSGMLAAAIFCVYQIRRRVTGRLCQVDLYQDGKKLTVTAYCDSGNLLRDPQSGKPVCILQREIWEHLETETIERKEILCHTISKDSQKLEVVTLDKMMIYQRGTVTQVTEPEMGLHTGEIMQQPKVQMLLHAAYM